MSWVASEAVFSTHSLERTKFLKRLFLYGVPAFMKAKGMLQIISQTHYLI